MSNKVLEVMGDLLKPLDHRVKWTTGDLNYDNCTIFSVQEFIKTYPNCKDELEKYMLGSSIK